jgi:hypothetical protein
MSKQNWADYLELALEGCQSTFKKTSVDNSDKKDLKYLCHDDETKKVYDFDKYVKKQNLKSNRPASPDAIYLGDKKLYFVEFKNQLEKNIDTANIKNKFESGTKILQNLLKDYSSSDCKKYFCLVIKNDEISNPNGFLSRNKNNSVISNPIKLKLDELNQENGTFYDAIFVQSVDFYKKEFIDLSCD